LALAINLSVAEEIRRFAYGAKGKTSSFGRSDSEEDETSLEISRD
jgi:hypothetical protein